MLKNNPDIKKAFEEWKKQNPASANDQEKILNWFYAKSPYWDNNIGLYPIGRIFEPNTLKNLEFTK
jgi:hypothetical protein